MQPLSQRVEMHNNYIKENISNEDQSNFENTNKALLNIPNDLLLNKKVVKISSNSFTKNNSVQLKNNIIVDDDTFSINKDQWIRNRLKIDPNMQERKIIYSLEAENDKSFKKNINLLSAYKDNGFYVIFKYINENNLGKEIKAKIKWNMFSNHFKIFDNNGNLIEEILYNFNFKGWKGPTKLQILLPFSNKKNINGIGINNSKLYMHKMENKSPEYNSIYKCFVLNFINRKVIPNEKNMQIIYSDLKED